MKYQDFVVGNRMGSQSLAIKRNAISIIRCIYCIDLTNKQPILSRQITYVNYHRFNYSIIFFFFRNLTCGCRSLAVTFVPMTKGMGIRSGRSRHSDVISITFRCWTKRIFCLFFASSPLSSSKKA